MRELVPGRRLAALIRSCQVVCVADCCGIDAFDFSSLQVAAFLVRPTGAVNPADVARVEFELNTLVGDALAESPDEHGLLCVIRGTNQGFTQASLPHLTGAIRAALQLASQVVDLASALAPKERSPS